MQNFQDSTGELLSDFNNEAKLEWYTKQVFEENLENLLFSFTCNAHS